MRNTLHPCYLAIDTRDALIINPPSSPKSQDILAVVYLPPASPRGHLLSCVHTPPGSYKLLPLQTETGFLSYTCSVAMPGNHVKVYVNDRFNI